MVGGGPQREASDAVDAVGAVGPGVGVPDELRDAALHEEIELVGQLVVAATSTPHRLSQTEIDRVLGVDGEPDSPPRRARGRHG